MLAWSRWCCLAWSVLVERTMVGWDVFRVLVVCTAGVGVKIRLLAGRWVAAAPDWRGSGATGAGICDWNWAVGRAGVVGGSGGVGSPPGRRLRRSCGGCVGRLAAG